MEAVQVLARDVSKTLSQAPLALFEQALLTPLTYVLKLGKLCTSQFVGERVTGVESPVQVLLVKIPKIIVPAEQLCHLT